MKEKKDTNWRKMTMMCRICSIPHKNTNRHELWRESKMCRICNGLLEFFSWNHNFLQQYWKNKGDEI